MRNIGIIAKREIMGYFATPLAYIFIVIFLTLTGAFAFYIGRFFTNEQANLVAFFSYHPWLYLMLIPAISMRLWAEERKTGTVELLLTLPTPTWTIVLGKFVAAWIFIGIAVAMFMTDVKLALVSLSFVPFLTIKAITTRNPRPDRLRCGYRSKPRGAAASAVSPSQRTITVSASRASGSSRLMAA